MLYAMDSDMQKRFEKMSAFEKITDLKAVFAPKARVERYCRGDDFRGMPRAALSTGWRPRSLHGVK
jgi:hypothetical protein